MSGELERPQREIRACRIGERRLPSALRIAARARA
jgi:hypothetical protein